ncbi:glyoxylate reductase [Byssothecium circinans]|uniref:Glyoxylate reductase n=1 Tax=Byssothecium circinans TaxID=147558 RepID=A0A6A5TMW6_9PLEO|nr:glyoxylate reductase [Byssothecium circinans]
MRMSKPKVLLLGEIEHAHDSWSSLSTVADIVIPRSRNRSEFLGECESGHLDGVLAIYRTYESVCLTGRFDEDLVLTLPASVKFVCHNGAGYDQIDIQSCTHRGIWVSNVPKIVNDAAADANFFLILGALRKFNTPLMTLRQGEWRGRTPLPLGQNPQGKVLGILGMGGIGGNLRKKAEAFSMRVIYHNRKPLSEGVAGSARYVSFEELLSMSDVISLNLPLNTETHHKISTREFSLMKKGVVIVNTARGAIINEAALVEALDNGHVACAGLDVYEEEPSIHPRLLANPHVILLPHMSTYTIETRTGTENLTIQNVRMAVEQGTLLNIVPEQAKHAK